MTFMQFCNKVAKDLNLDMVTPHEAQCRYATTSVTRRGKPVPERVVNFSDLTVNDSTMYMAEIYTNKALTGQSAYIGTISMEKTAHDIKPSFEHFESMVSPTNQYAEDGNPIGEQELWQFYYGSYLAVAIKSLLKGNSKTGRKPIRRW